MSSATPSPSDVPGARDWRLYLEDMLEFSQTVGDYTAGQNLASWTADAMRFDATLRKLSLIGEAATRVPADVREMAPDIPWRRIIGLRNRLMHSYPATDASVVWAIVTEDLPALPTALHRLLDRLPPAGG